MPNAFALIASELNGGGSLRPRAAVFNGATYDRITQDWFTQLLSADRELKGDLRRLRGAARSLARDNSFGSRFLNLLVENVVGHMGIRLQARVKNTRGGMNDSLNARIEDAWKNWATESGDASADGKMSFTDIQALVLRTIAQDGEPLVRILRGADNPFNFALHVLDVDQLDESYNSTERQSPTGNEIRMGVEIDRFGKPVAYWIWSDHPYDVSAMRNAKRVRVAAEDILHPFPIFRPGQTRGVTWFAPVMFDQQTLQAYQEAEITAARMGASNMAAVEIDPEKAAGMDPDSDGQPTGRSAIPMEMEPGRILRLGPGERLTGTEFNHPNTAFDPFTKAIHRSIAAGLNVAYSSLTGDLAAVNYSSIRAGLIAERDFYKRFQVWFATMFHRRVYRAWAPAASLSGWMPPSDGRGTESIAWHARGWKWVDPLNDIQAAILARRSGLATLTALSAEEGEDFEENLQRIAEENALAKQYGVELLLDTTARSTANDPQQQGSGGAGKPPANNNDSSTAAIAAMAESFKVMAQAVTDQSNAMKALATRELPPIHIHNEQRAGTKTMRTPEGREYTVTET